MQQLSRIGSLPARQDRDPPDAPAPWEPVSPADAADGDSRSSLIQVDEASLRRLVDESFEIADDWSAGPDGTLADREAADSARPDAGFDRSQSTTQHSAAVPATVAGRRLKRGVDIAGSLALLAALSPVFATCAAVVRLGSRGPILFRQKRVGRDGRTFTMLKFRTMFVDADQSVHEKYVKQYIDGAADGHHAEGATVFKLVGDPRVTPAGRWLRRLSLDELPQLVNVLRGEMSLVGPRPPLPYEVEHYRPRDLQRLRAKPGITGLWQVSGRNQTTFDEMIELDLKYIQRWSLILDLQILRRTIPVVLFPDGH